MWTPPWAKGDRRDEGDAGCSHIFGLSKELHFTLRALREIRASSPSQPNGLEGPLLRGGKLVRSLALEISVCRAPDFGASLR